MNNIIIDIYKKIEEYNKKLNLDAIPHSDVFFKEMNSFFGVENDNLRSIIHILKEAHMLFVFEVAREDKNRDVDSIDGFVIADLSVIRTLKTFFQNNLMDIYEDEFNKRLMPHQIVQEILPRMHAFQNSPIGSLANKSVMLQEYEHLIDKEYQDYTEEWKKIKLEELVKLNEDNINLFTPKAKKEKEKKKVKRAVDSDSYDEYAELQKKGSLRKVLNIYGVDFFFRVNLRKHNFNYISSVIESQYIDRKSDLLKLKDMIQKIKLNMVTDSELQSQSTEIYNLDRVLSRYIRVSKK